jgi:hypothetical protein
MFTPKQSIGVGRLRTPRSGFNPSSAGKRRTSLLAQLGRTPVSARSHLLKFKLNMKLKYLKNYIY